MGGPQDDDGFVFLPKDELVGCRSHFSRVDITSVRSDEGQDFTRKIRAFLSLLEEIVNVPGKGIRVFIVELPCPDCLPDFLRRKNAGQDKGQEKKGNRFFHVWPSHLMDGNKKNIA